VVEVEVLLKRWVTLEGERSMIAELDARHVPGARGDYCLIRSTESAMRRIWSYPADWHRLDDAKLMALFETPFTAGDAARAPARAVQPSRPRPESEIGLTA
jgi:hypothetical protein